LSHKLEVGERRSLASLYTLTTVYMFDLYLKTAKEVLVYKQMI